MNRMPAGWVGAEMHPLLAAYCRHITESERISAMLGTLDEALGYEVDQGKPQITVVCESARMRERLLTMRDRETRAASSLATRMRITPQSSYDKTKAIARQSARPFPWEEEFLQADPPRTGIDPDLIGPSRRR